jgi:hypothetical protein
LSKTGGNFLEWIFGGIASTSHSSLTTRKDRRIQVEIGAGLRSATIFICLISAACNKTFGDKNSSALVSAVYGRISSGRTSNHHLETVEHLR